MKTSVIKEQPVLSYNSQAYTECGGCNINCEPVNIRIYANDLRKAEVGDSWSVEDFDQCPNCQQRWDVSYTLVYKDKQGAAVLYRSDEPYNEEVELIWVELP